MDLFEKKVKEKDLSICFPRYTGGCIVDKAYTFMKTQFQDGVGIRTNVEYLKSDGKEEEATVEIMEHISTMLENTTVLVTEDDEIMINVE